MWWWVGVGMGVMGVLASRLWGHICPRVEEITFQKDGIPYLFPAGGDGTSMPLIIAHTSARNRTKSPSGYKNVNFDSRPRASKRPYQARDDDHKSIGMYATAAEAAAAYSCVLGLPKAQEMAALAQRQYGGMETRMTLKQALQLAASEGLTLRLATRPGSSTLFKGVCKMGTGPHPFLARMDSKGSRVTVGFYSTAEEAALMLARAWADKTA